MDQFLYCFRSESTRLNVDIAKTLTLFFFRSFFPSNSLSHFFLNSYYLNVIKVEFCVMLTLNSPNSFKAFQWLWSYFQVKAKSNRCGNSKLHKLFSQTFKWQYPHVALSVPLAQTLPLHGNNTDWIHMKLSLYQKKSLLNFILPISTHVYTRAHRERGR